MACDGEWRQESWLHQNSASPNDQRVENSEGEFDMEHHNLSLLLKVFPGLSLHSIAEAYTRADGDPNYAAELLTLGSLGSSFPDVGRATDRHATQRTVNENGHYFETIHKPLESSLHFESSNGQLDEVEKQNVGPFVTQRANGVHNHSGRPPEVISSAPFETSEWVSQPACLFGVSNGSIVGSNGRYGSNATSNSKTRGSGVGIAAGNCARNGTGNAFLGSGSTLLPGWKGFNSGNKVSAISGTVSCHRQRRNGFSNSGCGKDGKECREGDEMLFYGKQKKKKKGGLNVNEDMVNPTDAFEKQRAAEEFLHSMLGDGLELGLDVVRDVLEHFSGDTNKALETLLHMASASPGFHVNGFTEQERDEEPVQATNTLLFNELTPKSNPVSADSNEHSKFDCGDNPVEYFRKLPGYGRIHGHILSKLHESFPSVELNFLSEVLQASSCSYGDAVQALKEAGMTPMNERVPSKVDPAEVLQALFKNEPPDNTAGADSYIANQITVGEPYTVVAGRTRARSSASDITVAKANDEYEKHRGSANDHWTTMKRYFQEAAAAHSRGERALAGVLSEKGQLFKRLAREASLRASETIFTVKNKDIENNITIDLHAQHVKEAFQLLKLHLRSLSSISSVHTLTIITGHGSHSVSGRARIKPALTQYLARKSIPWKEPNAGCVVIKMSDVKAHYTSDKSSEGSSDESQ